MHQEIFAGSQDTFRVYLVDAYVDARTGKLVEAPINLEGSTIYLDFQITNGSLSFPKERRTMTALPDQGEEANTGYADYEWTLDDLREGTLTGTVTRIDTDGKHHKAEEFIFLVTEPLVWDLKEEGTTVEAAVEVGGEDDV